jgi:hypothetical protein
LYSSRVDFRQGGDQCHLPNHRKVLAFHGLVLSVAEKISVELAHFNIVCR